jgi:hypothetical protein
MINSALEHFKIKVLNTLIKKNELKYLEYETDLSEFFFIVSLKSFSHSIKTNKPK